ncbi:VOC family protein [Methylopila sp. Yamaguchi]|uniref:VOC family protein n=1 Tax=Methylopila sp. Yamaguchi TaxID=1437817 RepID=UPI000CB0A105|nr:VOC family protein [Methylopila sp. Yamaguchi]GBD50368.1 hypothetical protein METY_3581 [Methylopila sp. Yamaguchi]
MSKISPCLWFERDAEKAAAFYVSLLPDSRIDYVQKNVVDTPSGPAESTLVVAFTLAGCSYLGLNGGSPAAHSNALSLHVACEDQAEIDRLWDALLEGGEAQRCGWLNDRWGVPWQIVPKRMPELLADPDTTKAARVMRAMMGMVKLDVAALEAAHRGP